MCKKALRDHGPQKTDYDRLRQFIYNYLSFQYLREHYAVTKNQACVRHCVPCQVTLDSPWIEVYQFSQPFNREVAFNPKRFELIADRQTTGDDCGWRWLRCWLAALRLH